LIVLIAACCTHALYTDFVEAGIYIDCFSPLKVQAFNGIAHRGWKVCVGDAIGIQSTGVQTPEMGRINMLIRVPIEAVPGLESVAWVARIQPYADVKRYYSVFTAAGAGMGPSLMHSKYVCLNTNSYTAMNVVKGEYSRRHQRVWLIPY
jgi:hypothetical protein